MFTFRLNVTHFGKTMKPYLTVLMIVMFFALFCSLYADNSQNNTSKSYYSNNNSKASSNNAEKQKVEDKKQDKEEKKAAKAEEKAVKKEKKAKKQYYSDSKVTNVEKSTDKKTIRVEKQGNTELKDNNVEQYAPAPDRRGNLNNKNTYVEQQHSSNSVIQQTSDKVEQHNPGGLIPDATVQHNDGNHAPNDGHNWTDHHGDQNHFHVGNNGYFHDDHQHDFWTRRNHWHEHYPFFSFRLRFDLDNHFPYDDLYYYPTDYVLVDSRLSVVVLPFTFEDNEDRISNDITNKLMFELDNLRRFHVIDSERLERVMSRNDIDESDLVETYPAKKVGRLLGADLVIMGTIDRASDHVTLSVKCIDPFTGETVIKETATSDYTDDRNVNRLVKYLAVLIYNDVPLAEGIVRDIDEDEIELNIGSNEGLQLGTRCVIYREGRQVRHPYSGEYLGQQVTKVGEVYVVDIRESDATAKIISKTGRIRIGDKIIVK